MIMKGIRRVSPQSIEQHCAEAEYIRMRAQAFELARLLLQRRKTPRIGCANRADVVIPYGIAQGLAGHHGIEVKELHMIGGAV